jgi:hypothetical protein
MTALFTVAALVFLSQVPEQKVMSPEEVQAEVHKTLAASAGAIDACTTAYLTEYPASDGKVAISAIVGKSGAVGSATANTTLDGARNLRPCLESVAKKWKFPPVQRDAEPLSLTIVVKKGVKFTLKKPGEKDQAPASGAPADEGFVTFTPAAWGS